LRYEILERDKFTCRYCGQYAPNVRLEVDHVVAFADGGTDDPENLVTSCYACNRGKSALRQRTVKPPVRTYHGGGGGGARRHGTQDGSTTHRVKVLLQESPNLTPREIAERLDIKVDSARMMRNRVQRRGEL